jgi:hypothetical protein
MSSIAEHRARTVAPRHPQVEDAGAEPLAQDAARAWSRVWTGLLAVPAATVLTTTTLALRVISLAASAKADLDDRFQRLERRGRVRLLGDDRSAKRRWGLS